MGTGSLGDGQIERAIDRLARQFADDRVAAFGQLRVIARVNGQTLEDAARDVIGGRTRIEVVRDALAPDTDAGEVPRANGHAHERGPAPRVDPAARHPMSSLLRRRSADVMLQREQDQEERRSTPRTPWNRVGDPQP